jgi:DNA-binding NtrC family response regulator
MGTTKILLVDDDTKVLDLISRFLGEAGHQVVTSDSGNQALKRLKKGRFDLVISDVDLRDLRGTDLLKRIKRVDPSIPVILVSASDDVQKKDQALSLGAFYYLFKPFELDFLLGIVQSACLVDIHKEGEISSTPAR